MMVVLPGENSQLWSLKVAGNVPTDLDCGRLLSTLKMSLFGLKYQFWLHEKP